MRTLTGMTTDEAQLFGVSPRDQAAFIRVDDAKVNITAVDRGDVVQARRGAAGERNDMLPRRRQRADRGAVVSPDVFAKLDTATIDRILNKIEAGSYEGGRYSPAANATDRAAWPVVQEF